MRCSPSPKLLTLLLILAFAGALPAQQPCPAVPLPNPKDANIFNARQDVDLGDAIAEQIQRDFRVIDDEEVRSYLQRLGDRLVSRMPEQGFRFRFFIIDSPVVNAWAIAGGRIYVTRKMVVMAQSEDELAGVIGHEIGHIVSRDSAIATTAHLRAVLGVNSVGDRGDIFDKYHLLQENWRRKPDAFRYKRQHAEKDQLDADLLGLYLMTSAGYSPQAYSSFWDRWHNLKGKTGNWLSDFFGGTKPEQRRLREMLKFVEALPSSCIERASTPAGEYPAWREAVISYSGLGRKEVLPSLVSKQLLAPPLGGDLTHLRFSRDGRFALAQDDASIYVLSREPFEVLFRIDAPEANAAQFTHDSQYVLIHNPALRVEKWEIAAEKMTGAHELAVKTGCWQTALSHDGQYLACFSREFNLLLLEVATGKEVFEKKEFMMPNIFSFFRALALMGDEDVTVKWLEMNFSPDSRYLLAASDARTIGIELATRKEISLPGSIKRLMNVNFAFLGADRLVGVAGGKGDKSAIVEFPSGREISDLNLGRANLEAPASGNYVMIRPIDKYPLGVLDLATKKIFMANKKSAFDIFDRHYLAEKRNGEVGLYEIDQERPLATIKLPRGPIGRLRAAAVTPDLRWMAVSERHRGAVWNLNSGMRVLYTRGFQGAYVDGNNGFYADYPKFEETERTVARLDLMSRQVTSATKPPDDRARQYGRVIVNVKPAKEKGDRDRNVTLEATDTATGNMAWSRHFPKEAPGWFVSTIAGSIVLRWSVRESAAKDAIEQDPALKSALAAMKEKDGDYYLEALNLNTGQTYGRILIETGKGSFRISRALAVADRLVISDNENRVLVYSLSTGKQIGRVFGLAETISPDGKLLGVQNEPGQFLIYDLNSMEKLVEYTFSNRVSLAQFSADSRRLFALTSSQHIYFMDTTKLLLKNAAAQK